MKSKRTPTLEVVVLSGAVIAERRDERERERERSRVVVNVVMVKIYVPI